MDRELEVNALKRAGLTGASSICREEWGAIYRATHRTYGPVIAVLYAPESRSLFDAALPGLERWGNIAGGTVPGLLQIREVNGETDTPLVICTDPGGPTLADYAAEPRALKDIAAVFLDAARDLALAKTYEINLAGLTPFTLLLDPQAKAWKLLPVFPNSARGVKQLTGGRYAPPELEVGARLDELNADSYALARLWVDVLAGMPDRPLTPEAMRELIPHPRLRTLLRNGLTPSRGVYGETKLAQLGIERWLKKEADEDIAEVEEAAASAQRTPMQQKLHEYRPLLIKAGIAAAILLVLVALLVALPKMFATPKTTKTPYGMLALWGDALVARNAPLARNYTNPGAAAQSDALISDIERMERDALASRLKTVTPNVAGDGNTRTAKIDLYGTSGDLFMKAEATIKADDSGNWKIDTLFFQPQREKEG